MSFISFFRNFEIYHTTDGVVIKITFSPTIPPKTQKKKSKILQLQRRKGIFRFLMNFRVRRKFSCCLKRIKGMRENLNGFCHNPLSVDICEA